MPCKCCKCCIAGPQGPTGATGPSAITSFATRFDPSIGEAVIVPAGGFLSFASSEISSGITYDGINALTLGISGAYQVTFGVLSGMLEASAEFTLVQNGSPTTGGTLQLALASPDINQVMLVVMLRANAGDVLQVQNTSGISAVLGTTLVNANAPIDFISILRMAP